MYLRTYFTELVEWCDRAVQVLTPLTDRTEVEIMASDLTRANPA